MTPAGDITAVLQRWDNDRHSVVDSLLPIVYGELRKMAASYLRRERPGHTLQPAALINEAYLRLVRQESATFKDRAHFYGIAARLMRQILVDGVRSRQAGKRDAGNRATLNDQIQIKDQKLTLDFMALHEALIS